MLYERFQQIVSECTDTSLLISEGSWDKEEVALQQSKASILPNIPVSFCIIQTLSSTKLWA